MPKSQPTACQIALHAGLACRRPALSLVAAMENARPVPPLTFLNGPWRLSMGLNGLDLRDWLWLDERHAAEMAERERLIETQLDSVHAMLPAAEEAAREVLEFVSAWLVEHHPQRFEREGTALRERAGLRRVALDDPLPLRAAGRLVQEDLCLMQKQADGAYALTGAVLCFPAHWRLREKLGLPLAAIHAPVPGFAERLGGAAERFFASLAVERPVWRANWSLVDDPTLPQPFRGEPAPDVSAANAGQRLWLRVERQTLRRLPGTGAVLFTIRTLVRPLAAVAAEAAVAAALAARLREMDPAIAAYKALPRIREAVLGWLDRQAGDAAPIGPQQFSAARR